MSGEPSDPAQRVRTFDPSELPRGDMYYLLNSLVVPRPIAWVSTVDVGGRSNLAPHSYFTVASVSPPTLLFVSIGAKDTVRNVTATGDFVVHVVDRALAEAMNVTAIDAPHGVSEFELVGLDVLPSERVAPPRLAASPVAIECKLDHVLEVGDQPSYVILGEVLCVHVAERVFDERDRVAPDLLDAVARMGGATYSTTTDRFEMRRPRWSEDFAATTAHKEQS